MNLSPRLQKVTGLIIFTFFLVLNLFILVVLAASLTMDPANASQNAFQFVFCVALFSFPMFFGFRMYKIGKSGSLRLLAPIDREKVLLFKVKLSFAEYRNLMMLVTFTSPIFLFIALIALSFILPPLISNVEATAVSYVGVFFILFPVAAWIQTWKTYRTSKPVRENVEYAITAENIVAKGESFNTSIQWSSIHKVKEMKNWFLIFTNAQVAFLIPKKSFTDDGVATLKSFVINVPSIVKDF